MYAKNMLPDKQANGCYAQPSFYSIKMAKPPVYTL